MGQHGLVLHKMPMLRSMVSKLQTHESVCGTLLAALEGSNEPSAVPHRVEASRAQSASAGGVPPGTPSKRRRLNNKQHGAQASK
jgi:hypothetical protein